MKTIYLLFLILIIPFTVMAQRVIPQASPFDSYVRGESLISKGNQYFILPTLEARKGSSSTLQPQSASNQILAQKGNFLISEKQNGTLSTTSITSSDIYPVVLNPRSKQIGIVLGSLIVRMENVGLADQLVSLYGLARVEKYPRLKVAIFQGKFPGQVLEILDRIQQDPSVTSAEVEILENLKRPL